MAKKRSKSELRKARNIRKEKARKQRRDILNEDLSDVKLATPRNMDSESINITGLDHKLLNVNEANHIAGTYVSYFRNYQRYDLDNERIELNASDNLLLEIDGKKYVRIYGIVYDAKFGGDFRDQFIPDHISRICIGSPYVIKEDKTVKKFSNHLWLFVDDCLGGTSISPTFNIQMGDELTIIGEPISYTNHGVKKYGIGKWYVVNSSLIYWYKNSVHQFPSNKRGGFLFGVGGYHDEIQPDGSSLRFANYELISRREFEEYKDEFLNKHEYSFSYKESDNTLIYVCKEKDNES